MSISKLAEFFKDDTGQFSSMRLVFVISVLIIMGVWTYVSIHDHKLSDFPEGIRYIFGILFTGKVTQSVLFEKTP